MIVNVAGNTIDTDKRVIHLDNTELLKEHQKLIEMLYTHFEFLCRASGPTAPWVDLVVQDLASRLGAVESVIVDRGITTYKVLGNMLRHSVFLESPQYRS